MNTKNIETSQRTFHWFGIEEYSSGSAYNVFPAFLPWPTFELILKNTTEWIFDVLRVFLPESKYCSKGALEKLLIDSDISLVSEKLHLVLSRTKPRKSTLSWSMHFTWELRSSVCGESGIHTEGKTHMLEDSYLFHLCKWLFIHVSLQQMGFLRHSVDVNSCLSSSSPSVLWMLPFGKKKNPGREPF